MKIQFFCLLLALTVFACGGDTATSSDNQMDLEDKFSPAEIVAQAESYEDMIDLHDRIMPKMSSIAQMQKMLKDKMADADEDTKAKMEDAYNRLEKSYDGMMGWMQDYMKPIDELREMDSQEAIMAHMKNGSGAMSEIEQILTKGMDMSYEVLGISPTDMKSDTDHDHSDHDHGDHDHDHSDHDHDHDDHDHGDHDHDHSDHDHSGHNR